MNSFTLKSGRKVNKNASFCVATKTRGRWHHRYFKSYRGAQNDLRRTQAFLRDEDMVAYYGLEAVTLIKPDWRSREDFPPSFSNLFFSLKMLYLVNNPKERYLFERYEEQDEFFEFDENAHNSIIADCDLLEDIE